ncbi:TonB-linked outer membrane protein, SusC/RagA family [Saccharicrinis carchari]|uniref:TonB-linked outer membrane protein, SusC/RagA family n=1 Tax=Saccharicrinis carchari TaxID=1168039 RepID=A0A521D829_SACCC|nr:SusC/RagA family TonB-linked outer membrane protein [Saccharicrinis carchari]SMO67050.1 TonB-linked outer membrane protein, SusC/RagA family [Saccharicrinis carchari]
MRKLALLLCLVLFIGLETLTAQTKALTGKIVDNLGDPVPGVSIVVKGTTTGTISQMDGTYQLNVPENATSILFSFIGMETQEVPYTGQSTINVSMVPDTEDLDEVVVTALGIKRSEKSLGTAVTKVDQSQLVQKAESDVLKTMEGKVPGVNISSSGGSAGSATRITIRGTSSMLGNNEPLVVVDGIPYSNQNYQTTNMSTGGGAYGNAMATIDPNDIESMSVLKGASASALYGSRAANGVILITTKSGNARDTNKKFEITVNSSVTWEQIASLPDYQNTYGNGSNFNYANSNGSWGPRFDSMDSIPVWDGYKDYVGVLPGLDSDSVPYVAQPNNVESLFDTGMLVENSISIQKGSQTGAFNVTMSNSQNDSYIPFGEFERTSISVGGNSKLSNGFSVNGNLSFSTTDQTSGIFGNNQSSSDGGGGSGFARTLWLGRTWNMNLPYEDPVTGFPISTSPSQYDHPLWSWKHNQVRTQQDRTVANFGLDYEFAPWLNVSYKLGYNNLATNRLEIIDLGSRKFAGGGAIYEDHIQFREIESNLLLNVNKRLGDDFTIDGVIGHQVNQREQMRYTYQGKDFVSPGIYNMANVQSIVNTKSEEYKRRLIGLFFSGTLGYQDFAYLTVKGRNDWSSTLAPDNWSYFYPAVEGSFVFTNLIDIDKNILTYGKLRASWGKTGNDAGVYSIYPYYNIKTSTYFTDAAYPFNGQSTYSLPNTANNINLSPEFSTDFEIGAELRFLRNRIGIDLTYYNKVTTDLITAVQTPATSGYDQNYINVGEITNKGIELMLDANPVNYGGFSWDIIYTFAKNDNEVTELFGKDDDKVVLYGLFGDPQIVAQVGSPVASFEGNVPLRDDAGNLLIDFASGLPLIAPDKEIIGDPYHDFEMGLSNTLSFKGISVSAHLTYKHGGDFYSNSITSLLGRGVTKDNEDREKTVIVPGYYGDPNTNGPLLVDGNKVENSTQIQVNDLYFSSGDVSSFAINSVGYYQVYDRSVWRLNELAVGYNLPKSLLNRTPFGSVYLGFVGRNLWYHAPNLPEHTNFDPDMGTYGSGNVQGVEYSGAPSVKRYGFNLKVTF